MSAQVAPSAPLDAITAAVKAAAPAAQQAQAAAFGHAYYARLPEDELALRPIATWAAFASSALAFAQVRTPGQAKIRVFNPDPAVDGFDGANTVIQVVNDDMPFLVDSVNMVLTQQGIAQHGMVHPVFPVGRDAAGHMKTVGTGTPESYMHVEIDRQAGPEEMAAIEKAIAEVLADVRAAVADWQPMREKMLAIAGEIGSRTMPATAEQRAEAEAFLRWAADNHFTFLGYREYEVAEQGGRKMLCPVMGSGMGLMHGKDAEAAARPLAGLAAADLPPGATIEPLILTKTNARSTVHRPGYMDYIGVLVFDHKGTAIREQRWDPLESTCRHASLSIL